MTAVEIQLQSAIAQHQRGDLAAAAALYAEILQADPRVADAWHLSGLIAYQQGAPADAEKLIRRALELSPGQSEYLSNLAAVLLAADRPEEAEEAARAAMSTESVPGKSRRHLATALSRQGRYSEGIEILRQITAEQPLDAVAHCNLGAMLQEAKRCEEAVAILDTAVQLDPQSHQARVNYGGALRETGQLHHSLRELDEAVRLGPQIPQCYVNRGNTRLDLGDTTGALADFQQAVELNPQSAIALNGLGRTLQTCGQWKPALDALDLACRLDGPCSRFESNRLYCSSLAPHLSRRELSDLHADWGQRIEQQIPMLPPVAWQHDRIRIGYVSPDFRNHATMRFMLPLLEAHHHDHIDVYCYGEGRLDSVTSRVQACCHSWRSTRQLSDSDLAGQIRQDEIDVLIDLAGHTAGNRLPVFAMHPATVQASFLGYPNTTGLTRIDWFLTDEVRDSSESATFFSEQLLFLPHGACCFEAPSERPITDPPCLETGNITFGSTHRLEKLSDSCLQLWARVLDSVPNSTLLVIRDTLASEDTRQSVSQQLQAAGIDLERTRFQWELPADHLQIYDDIDLLLDVFPWGSGTTAYECMWMGVPIPTIAGDRGSCRATASMMHQLGLQELSAETPDEYVRLTEALATDLPRLQHLRRATRPAMQQTVCNAERFATDIEQACAFMLQSSQQDIHQ